MYKENVVSKDIGQDKIFKIADYGKNYTNRYVQIRIATSLFGRINCYVFTESAFFMLFSGFKNSINFIVFDLKYLTLNASIHPVITKSATNNKDF